MYKFATNTSVGMVRDVNEDSVAALDLQIDFQESKVKVLGLVVADGMGGYQAGEVASAMAQQCFMDSLPQIFSQGMADEDIKHSLKQIFIQANQSILDRSLSDQNCRGMGTTLTAVLCVGQKAFVAHAGDSRVYLLNQNGLRQVTRDDSLVNELVEAGTITPAEALNHPQKNIITKALGTEDSMDPQLLVLSLDKNDLVLLTSDGLTNFVSDVDIEKTLATSEDLPASLATLVRMAEEAGGYDNISAACCKYIGEDVA